MYHSSVVPSPLRPLDTIGRLIPNATGADMSMLAALLSGDLEELSALADQNSLTALLLGAVR